MRHQHFLVCLVLAATAFSAAGRQGSYLDRLTFATLPNQTSAIDYLLAGDIDICGYAITGGNIGYLKDSGVPYHLAYDGYQGILLNPVEYADDGRFNPLGDPVIRRAIQKLCDREDMVDRFLDGAGRPIYSAILPTDATYALIADEIAKTKAVFSFDEALAIQMISDRMLALGGQRNASGHWAIANAVTGQLEEIEIVGAIRTSDARRQMGDYFCEQLAKAGFATIKIYGSLGELYSYLSESPSKLTYSFYTESWLSEDMPLASSGTWSQMYTDQILSGFPYEAMDEAWCDRTFGPGFYEAARSIATDEYASVAERLELFRLCEARIRENPTHVWIWNTASAYMQPEGIAATNDLVKGTFSHPYVGHTLRFVDASGESLHGGEMVVANHRFLSDPINPVDGSDWIYDLAFLGPTVDFPIYVDPAAGIPVPHLVESARVEVIQGEPVTMDSTTVANGWCTLEFVGAIDVPADAWGDWDAANQVFLPISSVYPGGVTDCVSKVTLAYPRWLLDGTVRWHDDSPLTLADLVCGLIVGFPFDAAKPASAIYDTSRVSDYESRMNSFRGLKILSENPLVVEVYSSEVSLYAETMAKEQSLLLWPCSRNGRFMPAWHTFALGYLSEANGLGAFGESKATDQGVGWISYTDGPQLGLLVQNLATARTVSQFVPYAPTLGAHVTVGEIQQRYDNLESFVAQYGHLWIGTGPMRLAHVDTHAGIVTLENNASYFAETGQHVALPPSGSQVIYVDSMAGGPGPGDGSPGNPFKSLQVGVDHAARGDTVHVAAGTYCSALIDKRISLLGEGNEQCTIDGFIEIRLVGGSPTDRTEVRGFNVRENIRIDSSSGITISECRFEYVPNDAITMDGPCDSVTISQCVITTDHRIGIRMQETGSPNGLVSSITIERNTIGGEDIRNIVGISGDGVTGLRMVRNIIRNSITQGASIETVGQGVRLRQCADVEIIRCEIFGNDGSGIYLERCSSVQIDATKITGNGADNQLHGLYCRLSEPTGTGNVVQDNSADNVKGCGPSFPEPRGGVEICGDYDSIGSFHSAWSGFEAPELDSPSGWTSDFGIIGGKFQYSFESSNGTIIETSPSYNAPTHIPAVRYARGGTLALINSSADDAVFYDVVNLADPASPPIGLGMYPGMPTLHDTVRFLRNEQMVLITDVQPSTIDPEVSFHIMNLPSGKTVLRQVRPVGTFVDSHLYISRMHNYILICSMNSSGGKVHSIYPWVEKEGAYDSVPCWQETYSSYPQCKEIVRFSEELDESVVLVVGEHEIWLFDLTTGKDKKVDGLAPPLVEASIDVARETIVLKDASGQTATIPLSDLERP